MRRKDFIRRCGMGMAVVAVSAAMLSNNGEVKASSNAKISGLAGISLFVDNAYVQGENRVVKAKLDSVVPVDKVLSSFNSDLVSAFGLDTETLEGVVEDNQTATAPAISADQTSDDSDDGEEENKSADELESTEDEVKSKYENIGISVADPYVNIRKKAGEDSEIIGKLYKGSKCDILETKGDWVKIESGNAKGFIKAEYLARGCDAEKLIDDYGTKVAEVKVETLNVRFEANTDSRIATQIPAGEKLLVLKQKGDWYEVAVSDGDGDDDRITGWVLADYVKVKIQWKHAITIKEEKAEEARQAAAEAALLVIVISFQESGHRPERGLDELHDRRRSPPGTGRSTKDAQAVAQDDVEEQDEDEDDDDEQVDPNTVSV